MLGVLACAGDGVAVEVASTADTVAREENIWLNAVERLMVMAV